jgi:ComF family protein
MAVCVRNYFEGESDLIVFVPLNWLRQLKRGYNQTKLLANSLSSELAGTPVANALTKKARQASSQLTHELRAGNVANAISIKRGANVLGKHVLLVDDVVTTGSTLTECGRVLLEAGAVSVAAVTVCRAI